MKYIKLGTLIRFIDSLFRKERVVEKTKDGMCRRHYWGSDEFTNCPDCGFSKTFIKHEN